MNLFIFLVFFWVGCARAGGRHKKDLMLGFKAVAVNVE